MIACGLPDFIAENVSGGLDRVVDRKIRRARLFYDWLLFGRDLYSAADPALLDIIDQCLA